jgi:hypothetical protein
MGIEGVDGLQLDEGLTLFIGRAHHRAHCGDLADRAGVLKESKLFRAGFPMDQGESEIPAQDDAAL